MSEVKLAKLASGEVVPFDDCSSPTQSSYFDNGGWLYLGEGRLFLLEGKLIRPSYKAYPKTGYKTYHFYRKVD